MISMRYAHQAALGRGLVWNAGDGLQGYTNLGWTLVMLAVHELGLPLRLNAGVMQLLNLLLHCLLVSLVFLRLRPRVGSRVSLWACTLLALNGPLLTCGVQGFETTLQALLVTLALLPLVPTARDTVPSPRLPACGPVWLGLAAVVRLDAVVLWLVGSFALLLARAASSSGAERRPAVGREVSAVAAGGLLIVAVLLWQQLYYGDPLPNTVYLKASSDTRDVLRGLQYLYKFLMEDAQIFLALGTVACLGFGIGAGRDWRKRALLGSILGSWFAYIVFVGGDVLFHSRFFVPVIPIAAVCAAIWSAELVNRSRRPETAVDEHAVIGGSRRFASRLASVFLLGLAAPNLLIAPFQVGTDANFMRHWNTNNILIARALTNAQLPSDAVIAVAWAGVMPYFMPDAKFHDYLGKSDRHIAHQPAKWGPPGHNKWDFEYTLGEIKPAVIVSAFRYDDDTPKKFARTKRRMTRWISARRDFGMMPDLWLDPTFQRLYRPNQLVVRRNAHRSTEQKVYFRGGS